MDNKVIAYLSAGTTNYDYDVANQLIEVTSPNNAVTTFAYDNIGLRTQKALPNGITTCLENYTQVK